MSNDSLTEFRDLLTKWASEYARSMGLSNFTVVLPTDVHIEEAVGFLRALKAKIVLVDQRGRCTLPALHRSTRKPTEPCLFSRKGTTICLVWREYITPVGTVASLILDYAWPPSLVALDPRDWAFDVAGFSSPYANAAMLIAGETKKTPKELTMLLDTLLHASTASLTREQLGSADGHRKYRGLLQERPTFFWALAPGMRPTFSVTYAEGAVYLTEVADLPMFGTFATAHA